MPWSQALHEPVVLPDGRRLDTLADAGRYIAQLPETGQGFPEWQAAAEALLLVAEHWGPTMFARIGIMRALNHGKPNPDLGPRRKLAKAYRLVK